jgi:hypothetical protein
MPMAALTEPMLTGDEEIQNMYDDVGKHLDNTFYSTKDILNRKEQMKLQEMLEKVCIYLFSNVSRNNIHMVNMVPYGIPII